MNHKYVDFFKWVVLELTKLLILFCFGSFIMSFFVGIYYDRGVSLCILLPLSGFLIVFSVWMQTEFDSKCWYIYTIVITIVYIGLSAYMIPSYMCLLLFLILELIVLVTCYINYWICINNCCKSLIFIGGIIVVVFFLAIIISFANHGGVRNLKDFFCVIGTVIGMLIAYGGKCSEEEEYETDYFNNKDYKSIAVRITLIYGFSTLGALITRIIMKL